MSSSVANEIEATFGAEAEATVKFLRMNDRMFDCMNVRSSTEGLRKRKPDLLPYTSLNDPRFDVCIYRMLKIHTLAVKSIEDNNV